MSNKTTELPELIAYWDIQENLFQSYRQMFLTLEMLLLSVAILVVSTGENGLSQSILLISLFVVGVFTAYFILPIILKRGEVVFFWQAKILNAERGGEIIEPFREMKEFQKNTNHPFKEDPDYLSLSSGKHLTRNKLNVLLPGIIGLAWCAVAFAYILK